MIETDAVTGGPEQLIPEIEGQECNHCGSGELVPGEHKGRPGVLCDECEVPQVTFS